MIFHRPDTTRWCITCLSTPGFVPTCEQTVSQSAMQRNHLGYVLPGMLV